MAHEMEYIHAVDRCPSCQSRWVRRRDVSSFERIAMRLTSKEPYLCDSCGWRGWRIPLLAPSLPVRMHQPQTRDRAEVDPLSSIGEDVYPCDSIELFEAEIPSRHEGIREHQPESLRQASSPGAVFLSSAPQTFETDPGWPRVLAGMAAMVVLLGLVGFSLMQIRYTGSVRALLSVSGLSSAPDEPAAKTDEPTPAPETASSTPVEPAAPTGDTVADATPAAKGIPPTAANNTPPAAAREIPPAKEIARQNSTSESSNTRLAASSTPTLSETWRSPRLNDTRAPSLGLAQGSREERVLPQPPSGPAPSPLSPDESRPTVEAVALAMTNGSPTATATTGSDAAVGSAPAVDVRAPASHTLSASESRYEESLRIRGVLLRYENAYNRLDAKAASSVWPGVDQSALNRAFSGLVSQKVSLGLCDITVIGDIGSANCAGKARWEPKVGGGLQTSDRYWNFHLRRTGDGWKIQEIQVR
jgi:hypothetical protein